MRGTTSGADGRPPLPDPTNRLSAAAAGEDVEVAVDVERVQAVADEGGGVR
jgi:hypothetical protein